MPIERLYSKISGVTHHNADGTSRQEIIGELCYNGQPLLLIREPNQYSQDNIGVYVAYQIGYVNPELARKIAPVIDQGGEVDDQGVDRFSPRRA